ncbi:MAG: isoprenylcysteine carboxylmethyltransferase family protein [Spirochaetes bacterium]|nr:isoprenylcysteine carboxylmethyltransferase family protein [Spirochaetota bacterium]
MNNFGKKIIIYAAFVLGAGSLIMFYMFLFLGSFTLVNLNMGLLPALALDAFLSILFFLQHSLLIRRNVRNRLSKIVPDPYYGAFYAITSGAALLIMILFWQRTAAIASAEGLIYWLLRLSFILSMAGFYWGVKALGAFDPFGVVKIKLSMRNRELKIVPLAIRGPYRWVRHPLYFFSLIMIWACPDLAFDKLLFNVMWSLWIFIATMLEERDLVREFGNGYREYQKKVPMLIPYKKPL